MDKYARQKLLQIRSDIENISFSLFGLIIPDPIAHLST